MSDTPASLAERLQAEGQKTVEFFGNLSPNEWQSSIYTEGAHWSVKDILAHFVTAEDGVCRLLAGVLAGGEGTPEDFDIDAYNARKVASLKEASPQDLLAKFQAIRQTSIALVAGVKPEDLHRQGRHPWLGVAPVEDIIKLMYRHNQIHQRDIRRAIPRPGGEA